MLLHTELPDLETSPAVVLQDFFKKLGHLRKPNQLTQSSWGLSGYRARRRVADSRGPVLMAVLSLNR
jgi:hypothetical protein